MKPILYALFFFVILLGCEDQPTSNDKGILGIMNVESDALEYEYTEAQEEPDIAGTFAQLPSVSSTQTPEANGSSYGRKLIKDGSLKLRSDSIEESKVQLDEIVVAHKAEYGLEEFHEYGGYLEYRLRIDVPSGRFDDLVDAIEADFKKLENKVIRVKDVTEEFVDLETRLDSKLAVLARYREILAKAKNVEEILMIESKIRVIEEEIEATKGRLKYLSSLSSTGHLEVTIIEEIDWTTSVDKPGPFDRLSRSFLSGWRFVVNLFYFLVRIWPLLLFGGVLWFVLRRARPRNRNS